MNECSCECWDAYDAAMPDVYRELEVTARKPRACDGCGGAVGRGDRVTVIEGLWDGRWSRYTYHHACHEILNQGPEDWVLGCSILGCAIGSLYGAVWPRDRRQIELVSEVVENSMKRGW